MLDTRNSSASSRCSTLSISLEFFVLINLFTCCKIVSLSEQSFPIDAAAKQVGTPSSFTPHGNLLVKSLRVCSNHFLLKLYFFVCCLIRLLPLLSLRGTQL
uniref:(northern house mosquito) hypothetical protein n=1 Tax=Culex pipiens TaxID=7175 RepID=A0A8D8APM9_CULPI